MHFKHLSFSLPCPRQPTERNPWYPDCGKLNVGFSPAWGLGSFLSVGLPFVHPSVPAFSHSSLTVFLKETGLSGCLSCGVPRAAFCTAFPVVVLNRFFCPVSCRLAVRPKGLTRICFFLWKLLPRWCFVPPLGGMYVSYLASGHLFRWSPDSFWHDPRNSWFLLFLWGKNYLEKRFQVLGVLISLGHFK